MRSEGGLDKRKAYILATVVYEYIATAEPVGSNTLTQKYNLGVSSATVRNEMAELEAEGYLVQPHTSAGRVPSDAGYRTYVDELMQPESLAPDDRRRIRDDLREASRELDDLIEGATRLVSRLSNNLAFVTKPQPDTQSFKHIQLIWLSPRTGVAIVVTSLGVATQSVFEVSSDLDADALTQLSNALNARLSKRLMRDITESDVQAAIEELGLSDELRGVVLAAMRTARSAQAPVDRCRGRAESARSAGVSGPAQTALDLAHRRRAEDALRHGRGRNRQRNAGREDRRRTRARRIRGPLDRYGAVPVRRERDRHALDPRSAPDALRPSRRARVGNSRYSF